MRLIHAAAALLAFPSVQAAPLAARDHNPLLAGAAPPAAFPAALPSAGWSWSLDLAWSSSASVERDADETLIVDAEVREARLTIAVPLDERSALRIQLPYRYTGGGSLDGLIDDWHDFFGMSEGSRPQLPQDALQIYYARAGDVMVNIQSGDADPGDIALEYGRALLASDRAAASAWLSIELPTGNREALTGNEAVDATLGIAGERRWRDRWSGFGQIAVSWLTAPGWLGSSDRKAVWSGMAGLSWRAHRKVELTAQLDGRTRILGGDLDLLGPALTLTAGGALLFDSGWRVELGVIEDVLVGSTADVTFLLSIRSAR